jgi:hypothetical protein
LRWEWAEYNTRKGNKPAPQYGDSTPGTSGTGAINQHLQGRFGDFAAIRGLMGVVWGKKYQLHYRKEYPHLAFSNGG